MAVIDLKTDDGIRAEREHRFKQVVLERTARLEIQLCEANLVRMREELDALCREMESVRNERKGWERRHAAAIVAQEFLRNHRPHWVDEALAALDQERRELMDNSEQRRRRVAYLRQQLTLASRQGAPSPELITTLHEAERDLDPHTKRLESIRSEQAELIARCLTEAWPDPPATASQPTEASSSEPVAPPARGRRVTPAGTPA